jgi:hypothetical protein
MKRRPIVWLLKPKLSKVVDVPVTTVDVVLALQDVVHRVDQVAEPEDRAGGSFRDLFNQKKSKNVYSYDNSG